MSFTSVDAVMQTPDSRNQYWIFSGNQYIRVNVTDDEHTDTRVEGPSPLSKWSTLAGAPFSGKVDAVMPVPDVVGRYWLFSDDQYEQIEVGPGPDYPDSLISGPGNVSDWTNTFKDRPPYSSRLDAVAWAPDFTNYFWVFSGSSFLTVSVGDGPGHVDELEYDSKPLSDWASLNQVGGRFLTRIDAVMQTPDSNNDYWFFSGDQYIGVNITDAEDGHADSLTSGPNPLSNWAGFQF